MMANGTTFKSDLIEIFKSSIKVHGHMSQLENEFLNYLYYLLRYSVVTYKNGPLFTANWQVYLCINYFITVF